MVAIKLQKKRIYQVNLTPICNALNGIYRRLTMLPYKHIETCTFTGHPKKDWSWCL